MRVAGLLLATITDGRAAWDEFFSGLQETLHQNAATWPILGLILIALIMVCLDVRLARLLVGQRRRRGDESAPDR
jgi:hypothetical protein